MHQADDERHGLEKIRSKILRHEVMNRDGGSMVVVVEVDLPVARLEAFSSDDAGEPRLSRYRFAAAGADPEQIDQRVSDVRKGIEDITGRGPESYLASSGTFVVEANGEQIRHIAELPSVAAIWANSGV